MGKDHRWISSCFRWPRPSAAPPGSQLRAADNRVFQWKYFPASVGNNVESDILGFFLLQQSPDEGGKTRNQLGRGLSVCFTLYVIYSFVPNTFIVVVQELEALK